MALVGTLGVIGGTLLHAQTVEVEGEATFSAKRAKISVEDMRGQVTILSAQAADDAQHVEQLRLTARKQKDVIKLNCINDKYLQIKSLLNISDEAASRLDVAILGKDEEGRYHEFTKFTISVEKVKALAGEADACVGEELTYLGDTIVDVDKPEKCRTIRPPRDPFDDVIEPPAYASPFD